MERLCRLSRLGSLRKNSLNSLNSLIINCFRFPRRCAPRNDGCVCAFVCASLRGLGQAVAISRKAMLPYIVMLSNANVAIKPSAEQVHLLCRGGARSRNSSISSKPTRDSVDSA